MRIPGSAKLIFDHQGGDSEGLLLDNINLTKVSGQDPGRQVQTATSDLPLRPQQPVAPMILKDVFRLSNGELIIGELLSFDRSSFTIRADKGVIEKKR